MAASLPTVAFRSHLALELELISLRRLLASKAPALRVPVRATFYQIVWVQRGQAQHTVDLQRVTLEAGSLLFVGPGRVHTFDLTADYEGQVLLFTDAFFARSAAAAQFLHTTSLFQPLPNVPLVLVDRPDSPLPTLWAQLATELRQAPDVYQPVVLQQLVHTFLLLAERAQRRQGQQLLDRSPWLAYTVQFRALVEQQFQVTRSVRGYAAQLHLSEKRLAQATTHVLGKPPKQVIDERVILEAKRLLTHTPASIKEIGFALGFGEPTNFIKYFRRQTRFTPHEFRAQHTR